MTQTLAGLAQSIASRVHKLDKASESYADSVSSYADGATKIAVIVSGWASLAAKDAVRSAEMQIDIINNKEIVEEIVKIMDSDASLYGGRGQRRREGEKASEHLARLQQEQQQSHELRETRLSLWNKSIV
jgi:hypothetical protein